MADDKLAGIWKTQKSLTEWLEDIKHKDTNAIRTEDNNKRERLKVLSQTIGLPFDEPTQFEATDLANETLAFKEFLANRGNEPCALRLIPKNDDLPKLRMRGKTIAGAYEWFKEQAIDPADYRADFVPHEECVFSTTFIVNQYGIQGEIIRGGHHQLTQGFHEEATPATFKYDFTNWSINPADKEALEHLKQVIAHVSVPDAVIRQKLSDELEATFTDSGYLEGYFETTYSTDFGIWFKDYNRMLGKLYSEANMDVLVASDSTVSGQVGSPGKATGIVRIVDPADIGKSFEDGGILVCSVTTPEYVPLMQRAAAIVTDQGGILSHAAIVARELKKPCIVGTGNATETLKDGQQVEVDADSGTVQPL